MVYFFQVVVVVVVGVCPCVCFFLSHTLPAQEIDDV